jgi:hypothetical protein
MSLSRKKSGKTVTLHSLGFFRSRKFFSSFLHSAMDIERLLLVYFQKAKIPFDLMLLTGILEEGEEQFAV